MRALVGRIVAATTATIALIACGMVAGPVSTASAYTGADFDRGYIISDAQFYDNDAMTEAEIQSFLDTKIGTCNDANCLNIVRTNTFSRAADRTVCASYTGAAAETTAAIIYKVQVACGISAKVLLVTLQKEQGLVTHKSPSMGRLAAAMGYGCPDTAPCDAEYYGLYNQLYKAAWQFKRYSTPDQWGNIQPGGNLISLSTNACGTMWVNVRNNATAALYNYTPYTPNQAALDNLGSEGDWCSSYGNRNFWDYYYSWFGNPTGVTPAVTTERLGGVDRFETAALISQAARPASTADVVYIANAYNYPDALGAAPAATFQDGPLLLVPADSLPPVVATELQRLHPRLIVVVGGEASVSTQLFTELGGYATEIRRDGGEDRYATSRLIAENAFPAGSTTAYIATGQGFADALSAGAAAGTRNAPVILTYGPADAADPATLATLTKLGVTNAIIVGSEASVSAGVASSIAGLGITVTRFGGKDRWATAGLINRDAFPTSGTVYLASGVNFPDALAGAAIAGSKDSALLLSYTTCVSRQTAQDIVDLQATKVVMLGGIPSLANSVAAYANCD